MYKNNKFCKNPEKRQLSFKRSHFVLLMCIGLITILAFTMANNQLASAGYTGKTLINDTPEYPMEPGNYTENNRCNYPECHDEEPSPWIEVLLVDDQASYQIYSVTGQTDAHAWIEGWGVFISDTPNNVAGGLGPSEFQIDKEETEMNYTVYWVDSRDPVVGRGGSNFTNITVPPSENTPPTAPIIEGQSEGYKGTSYDYKFTSEDNENHNIYYYINWGDGNFEDWDGPFESGETKTIGHTWQEIGLYTITAKARDEKDLESDWNTFEVNITNKTITPKIKIRLKMVGIAKLRVTFENKGQDDLSDIQFTVTAKGGIFRLFPRVKVNYNGTIDNLAVGQKVEKKVPDDSLKFRFCAAKVTVTAFVDGEKVAEHSQYVVVIGRLVFARPILPFRP